MNWIIFKLCLVGVICLWLGGCMVPKCKDDINYQFDRQGRPIKGKKGGTVPPILMKRCPKPQCKTQKIHCHGNGMYRGSPWWKAQNPDIGENLKENKE